MKILVLKSSGNKHGSSNMLALFSFQGDFLDYLGLENMGVFTAHGAENKSDSKYNELKAFGESLV